MTTLSHRIPGRSAIEPSGPSIEPWLSRINPQLHTVWHGGWRKGILESPRILSDHELILVSRGCCLVEIGADQLECRGPYFLIIPPRRAHLSMASSDTFRYCAHFDWEYQRSGAPEPLYHFLPDEPSPTQIRMAPAWIPACVLHGPIQTDSPVLSLAQSLAIRWMEADASSRASCRPILLDILIRILARAHREAMPPVQSDKRTTLAMEIKNRLDFMELSNGGVQMQLRSLGYRHEHLSRVFKQAFGIAPLRYWENMRLEKAKRMLRSNEGMTITEVAHELGFHDATHFCRSFRRHTGMSPRQYSQSNG